jgi:hypothetical protein
MIKTIVLSLLCVSLPSPQGRVPCMRIMPTVELVSHSMLIARVRVLNVEESEWGVYRQIADVELVDVIDGDFTLKRARIGAASGVACASDQYRKKEEWLVFLGLDGGIYHTINYQHGQFRIDGDVVRAWRNGDSGVTHKPYYSVREEVEAIIAGIRTPAPEPASDLPAPAPVPPPTAAPQSQVQAPDPRRPQRKVAVPIKKERFPDQR